MTEPDRVERCDGACAGDAAACVFRRVLLARSAGCEMSARHALGERDVIVCRSPAARTNCGTLAALLHERSRFALKLPRPGAPLLHALALRLHCGGIAGLQRALDSADTDVHRLVGLAHERHGSLTELPWPLIVDTIVAWRTRRQRGAT
jgi:hypothetical protein